MDEKIGDVTLKNSLAISNLLVGKSVFERAEVKANEVIKLDCVGSRDTEFLKIEIVSVGKIAGGVEVFAKGWKDGKQFGFGKDGSVEIERFRIFNPPILVDDPTGTIVREWVNPVTKLVEKRTLREDPKQALFEVLQRAVSISGKISDNIISGKRGSTTDTYYPSMDGWLNNLYAKYSGVAWATMKASSTGAAKDDTDTITRVGLLHDEASGDKWRAIERSVWLFDTSAIPDTDTIDSASLTLTSNGKAAAENFYEAVNIYASSPASDTALATGDLHSFGTTKFCDTGCQLASWPASGSTQEFIFNASGLAAISKTGKTKLGGRGSEFDAGSGTPSGSASGNVNEIYIRSVDYTGTTSDPLLTVVHSSPVVGPAKLKTMNTLATAKIKTVDSLAIAKIKTIDTLA